MYNIRGHTVVMSTFQNTYTPVVVLEITHVILSNTTSLFKIRFNDLGLKQILQILEYSLKILVLGE